jgi:exopolyphosphatase / guanosine-5'-triphosphate,3'-diphosphate pyrophosphatase
MITSIIDVGTRSIKHFVFDNKTEIYHHKDSSIKLGEYIHDGILDEQGINVSINHIKSEMQKVLQYKIDTTIITATEALRQANNSNEFIKRVKLETDIILKIITHEDETILLGKPFLKILKDNFAVLNIGGGSTEVSVYKHSTWHNIPIKLGVNNINQKFLKNSYEFGIYNDRLAWNQVNEFIRIEIEKAFNSHELLTADNIIITGTLKFISKQQSLIDIEFDKCSVANHPISINIAKYAQYVETLKTIGVKRLAENYPDDPGYADNFAIGQSVYLAIAQKLQGKTIIPSEFQYIHGLLDVE